MEADSLFDAAAADVFSVIQMECDVEMLVEALLAGLFEVKRAGYSVGGDIVGWTERMSAAVRRTTMLGERGSYGSKWPHPGPDRIDRGGIVAAGYISSR
jgi:hypothetical protein